jgi:two-component system sensor histidine kinase ChvG
MRLGLRAQLLIVSSLLLAIPFLGLRSAREIEAFLVETQEQGLASTARAVATALHERPGVFVIDATPSKDGDAKTPLLRIETLDRPIVVDGLGDDWSGQRGEIKELVAPSPEGPEESRTAAPLRLRYRLGRFERNIYALLEVRDDSVVRFDSDFPGLDASDHVEIAAVSADDEFLRFAVHESGDGSARVTLVHPDGSETLDPRIEAVLTETDEGYRVELRIPRTLIGSRLSLAVVDVDDRATRVVAGRLSTGGTGRREDLGRVFVPSPELAALAQGLGRARSRIWVLDRAGRVLAQAGTLQGGRLPQSPPTWRQSLVAALRPLYGSILVEPTEDFADKGPDAVQLEGAEINEALQGKGAHWRRRTSDGRAVVLSAAEPVWSELKVVGAVLAEETTNETLAARNRAFERLFFSIAFAVFFGALALLAFATFVSFRIRRLRDLVERAIDRQGRVKSDIPPSPAGDEIGDLSRSFGSMLERQQQYTAYLEELRGRLSHEIRTPVAVVRSSLDNLRLHPIPAPASVYLDRADEGLSRLVTIVQRMTEASRLEQTLATSERESFDLARVVRGCVDGYRLAHPARRIDFVLDDSGRPMMLEGAPDLVAQLLDKLVENALDFAREGTAVEVRLTRGLGLALLAVTNEGPPLEDDVAEKLFEVMVSKRPAEGGGKVHLGLGLTIVRAIADFHQATVNAANRREPSGVSVTVAFPLRAGS